MVSNGRQYTTEAHPSAADGGQTVTQNDFKITTRKLPILKAEPIEKMTENLGIALPEMIFGDNLVSIEHAESSFGISFNTYDALDLVDKTGGSMLQVAHSKEWQSTREKKHEGITEVVKPFDWSYSTTYKGTLRRDSPDFQPSQTPIPLHLLMRQDPILFFDDVMLYEDEMADNGITMLSCKIRVMPQRLLLLCRFFMRLDNVLIRIRDTRVYIDFRKGEIIREYQAKEERYEVVRQPQPYQRHGGRTKVDQLQTDASQVHHPVTTPAPATSTQKAQEATQFSPVRTIAKEFRKRASATTETYIAYAACEKLVTECARQANYVMPQAEQKNIDIPKTKEGEDLGKGDGWWYESVLCDPRFLSNTDILAALELPPTFNTWAQVTFLHMYMLTCRFRMFPYASTWHQHLLDHFFFMAEDRMTKQHGIVAGSARSKYLKDLFVQWRGLTAGYDEGLVKGDAVLATAVWRNIFKADDNVDFRGIGQIVSYVRGVLQGLEKIPDEDIASGDVAFSSPERERNSVMIRSRMMETLVDVKYSEAMPTK
ncbi:uncharacterized protein KY384_003150 [Bacidia gigantensis]|uniref:uncharacterized protein n=1 Tax=Bacidia gigantensis TaxID=2732470 RepID=UPI001D038739|nr:uncharacterized protein KY384_003150 [Bacidia gigantensis]KAG8531521.1 hypothetical protein KY384_003150 [Bacidia gigantensis]